MHRNSTLHALKDLLQDQSIFEIGNWHSFEVDFSTDFNNSKQVRKHIFDNIENLLADRNANGLYAIQSPSNQLLYVGKGRPIGKRLYDHYSKVHLHQYNPKYKTWFDFFSSHCNGKVICRVVKLDIVPELKTISDNFREIIEQMIITENDIAFEKYRKLNPSERSETQQ